MAHHKGNADMKIHRKVSQLHFFGFHLFFFSFLGLALYKKFRCRSLKFIAYAQFTLFPIVSLHKICENTGSSDPYSPV